VCAPYSSFEDWRSGAVCYGHTVTVTGDSVKLPDAQESKKEASEKAEAGSAPYGDFQATSVKMVSTSCSQ
jgi:hypothetical protein